MLGQGVLESSPSDSILSHAAQLVRTLKLQACWGSLGPGPGVVV